MIEFFCFVFFFITLHPSFVEVVVVGSSGGGGGGFFPLAIDFFIIFGNGQ